jgi:membrane-bound lytic murein transglycosylase F
MTLALVASPGPVRGAAAPPVAPRTVLRILVVPDLERPDFFSLDSTDRPGFEREILEGFARAQHLRLEFVPAKSWEEVISALVDGRGDLIAGHCTNTEERRRFIAFTDGVLPTRTVVVTRKPHAPILEAKDLMSARIGAVRGSASYQDLIAAGVPRSHIDDSVTQSNVFEVLRSGKVTSVARSAPLAILGQREDPSFDLGMFIGPPSSFAWGIRKDDLALQKALNNHLTMVRRAGVWSRLVLKYFGTSSLTILKRAQEP